ncbi:MAG TPA: prephenate dehydrogenase/arogenate dehydrogenase family protein [Tepidisphaeraceae bacterium]
MGLLGGSLGMAVKSALSGCVVAGYAHRKETLDLAMKAGAADEGFTDPLEAVRDADLVVLCTPVLMLSPLLRQLGPGLMDDAIVTDVGSTKASIVRDAERILGQRGRFVGSHPMAGSEKRGVEFARADLFEGSVCITTPTAQTDLAALTTVEQFWTVLGMKVVRIDPVRHDELLADVSHLPHAVAAALVSIQEEAALGLCGKGFLDLTRIAGGDGGLWRDIFLDNRAAVRHSIGRLIDELKVLDSLLERGDSEGIKAWLSAASARRKKLVERKQQDSESQSS